MKIRMKDIARLANVSETTVSLVLNDKLTRISQTKKDEIKRIARDLNYVPNMSAKNLANNRTNTIGLLIPDIENPFFSTLAKTVEKTLREQNYYTVLVNSDDNVDNEKSLIDNLINLGVDGLLITLSNEAFLKKQETINRLKKLPVPYVLLDRQLDSFDCSQVFFDNYLGGVLATTYLINLGHKAIGFIKTPDYIENGHMRFLGYLDTMKKAEILPKEKWIVEGSYKYIEGYNMSSQLLINNSITAVIASNDLLLLGLLKKSDELGIKIPDNLSVIGYDYSSYLEMIPNSPTTIYQNSKQMATKACSLLIENISGNSFEKIVLEPQLRIGKSTKKIDSANN